jgi:predicted nucleic acid-binding protein
MALTMVQLKFLLDTNILIGLLKDDEATKLLLQTAGCNLAAASVSQITRMELLGFAGLNEQDERIIQQLLGAVHVLLLDEAVEARTIALRRQFKMKLPDAIIAATALVHGLQLLTLDQHLYKTANHEVNQ